MKRELPFYEVDGKYGFDQDDFPNFMMKLGGCAAVAACDSCIYFDRYKGISGLYPYDSEKVSREDYLDFADEMRPYLSPRLGGINRLELYIEGFSQFLGDRKCSAVKMEPFHGTEPEESAQEALTEQIDLGFPVPFLMLLHKDRALRDYNWHWFTLTGYEKKEDSFLVKAVTFGKAVWFDFKIFWDTGHEKKGGMILLSL